MTNRIDTVSARNKLPIRREPYWYKIGKELRVGFRKMSNEADGSWHVRHRDESGKEDQRSLGTMEEYPPNERFNKAVAAARDWVARAPARKLGDTVQRATVMDVCDAYVKRIRELKGDKPADDLETRYRRVVRSQPIHAIDIAVLTREHLREFRRCLIAAPVRVNTAGDIRVRSKDTVNRDMAALRAALNQALADQIVTSDFAWREPLKAFKNVSKRRSLYLDREQRRNLIANADDDLAKFLWGLSILPLRPGALALLKVEDFECRLGVLKIGTDKGGHERRIKLPSEIIGTFKQAAENRSPSAPLLARADGKAWNKDSWKGPFKKAALSAGLPPKTTAYTLRHSVITDLVHGGLDLLTVAQISGTSVAMIEKHYGHLRSDVAAVALAKLAL